MKRIRIGNDLVELAFNGNTGELLELVNKTSGDNLLKNWLNCRSMPFNIILKDLDGNEFSACAPLYKDVLESMDYIPDFKIVDSDNNVKKLNIYFKCLKSQKGRVDVRVNVQIIVVPDDYETIWTIDIENNHNGILIETVKFPCLFGIYLGESWKNDTLVYPFNAGLKVENPVETFASAPKTVGWKWQEYKYTYFLDNYYTPRDNDGAYTREIQYSGPASMNWMDYYGTEEGFYIASYDEELNVSGMHIETFGPDKPGMGFYMVKYPRVKSGGIWNSNRFGIAVHPGDWHWGADRYREWRLKVDNGTAAELPDWLKKSPGLAAHYDFKYQSGEIVHRFKDITKIFLQAKEMGLKHLLISGWNKDGFDNGFPIYRPDPELGTEKELMEQVQEVVKSGGHISFYINTRLFNTRYSSAMDLEQLKNSSAVRNKAGELRTECYGHDEVVFAVMCSASSGWQDYLIDTIQYLVDTIGADGIYLDQLAMAGPELCHSNMHDDHHDWNYGYGKFLNKLNTCYSSVNGEAAKRISLIYEGVSDIHGHKTGGQLISTFFYHHFGAFPELYRYTFPDQILVDMVYPSKGQVMRPVHISQVSEEMIDRAFIIGCYLWIYDLDEDNTFCKDPVMMQYLKDVIALRKLWLERFGNGIYKDDRGILTENKNVIVKKYILHDGNYLITICNKSKEDKWKLIFDLDGKKAKSILLFQLGNKNASVISDDQYEVCEVTKYLEVMVTSTKLAFLHVIIDG